MGWICCLKIQKEKRLIQNVPLNAETGRGKRRREWPDIAVRSTNNLPLTEGIVERTGPRRRGNQKIEGRKSRLRRPPHEISFKDALNERISRRERVEGGTQAPRWKWEIFLWQEGGQ